MTDRVYTYARVSTKEQADESKSSLQQQLEACNEYCKSKGYEVVGAESDDCSGVLPISGRTGLQRLYENAQSDNVVAIIVRDIDRLLRDDFVGGMIIETFRKIGVRFEFCGGERTDDINSKLIIGIKKVLSDYERLLIKDRTSRGRRGAARRGVFISGGHTPYGYRLVDTGTLEIDPIQSKVVRMIFDRFLQGEPIKTIARYLNESQIPTSTGTTTWKSPTIKFMLQNQTYAGVYSYGKRRVNEDGKLVSRDSSDWISVPTPIIISPAKFKKAQKRLDDNFELYLSKGKFEYLLQGRVSCSICGKNYWSESQRQKPNPKHEKDVYRYYSHPGREYREGCPNRVRLNADKLEQDVLDWLYEQVSNPQTLKEEETQNNRINSEIEIKQGTLDKLNKKLDRLQQGFLLGLFDENDVQKETHNIRNSQAELIHQINTLHNQQAMDPSEIDSLMGIMESLHDAFIEYEFEQGGTTDMIDTKYWSKYINELDVRVTVSPEDIIFKSTYENNDNTTHCNITFTESYINGVEHERA